MIKIIIIPLVLIVLAVITLASIFYKGNQNDINVTKEISKTAKEIKENPDAPFVLKLFQMKVKGCPYMLLSHDVFDKDKVRLSYIDSLATSISEINDIFNSLDESEMTKNEKLQDILHPNQEYSASIAIKNENLLNCRKIYSSMLYKISFNRNGIDIISYIRFFVQMLEFHKLDKNSENRILFFIYDNKLYTIEYYLNVDKRKNPIIFYDFNSSNINATDFLLAMLYKLIIN